MARRGPPSIVQSCISGQFIIAYPCLVGRRSSFSPVDGYCAHCGPRSSGQNVIRARRLHRHNITPRFNKLWNCQAAVTCSLSSLHPASCCCCCCCCPFLCFSSVHSGIVLGLSRLGHRCHIGELASSFSSLIPPHRAVLLHFFPSCTASMPRLLGGYLPSHLLAQPILLGNQWPR
ncbi:hypothetical protein LZ32DRAFT_407160 [Colletotrichum eremochloae]|nr:hypothetical protein LZ32DRAFT_407160 [Colletotrichum eremochloae]